MTPRIRQTDRGMQVTLIPPRLDFSEIRNCYPVYFMMMETESHRVANPPVLTFLISSPGTATTHFKATETRHFGFGVNSYAMIRWTFEKPLETYP